MLSPETLRRYPFFNGATDDSLRELAMVSEEKVFGKGEHLFEDGEAADYLFILTQGEVDITHLLGDGERRTVDTRVAGDLVAWSAVVHPYRMTACGVARRETAALAVDSRKLRELCEMDLNLGYHLFKTIAEIVSQRLMGARVQLATV